MIQAAVAAQRRSTQRRAHLLAALLLIAYIYLPLGAALEDIVRFGVLPSLALSGIAMWQAARIRRTLRAMGGSARENRP